MFKKRHFQSSSIDGESRDFILPPFMGIPVVLQKDLAKHLINKREASVEGRSHGCQGNDSFSIFSFLAFLLVLYNLYLRLMGTGRKKRELPSHQLKMVDPSLSIAIYSLYQGFSNAIESESQSCSQKFFCEGAFHAAKVGSVGRVMADLASKEAESIFSRQNSTLSSGIENAGIFGSRFASSEEDCQAKYFECVGQPLNYRTPEVRRRQEINPQQLEIFDQMHSAMKIESIKCFGEN